MMMMMIMIIIIIIINSKSATLMDTSSIKTAGQQIYFISIVFNKMQMPADAATFVRYIYIATASAARWTLALDNQPLSSAAHDPNGMAVLVEQVKPYTCSLFSLRNHSASPLWVKPYTCSLFSPCLFQRRCSSG